MAQIKRPLYCLRCSTSEVKDGICTRCGYTKVGTKPPQQWVLSYNDRIFLKMLYIAAE